MNQRSCARLQNLHWLSHPQTHKANVCGDIGYILIISLHTLNLLQTPAS